MLLKPRIPTNHRKFWKFATPSTRSCLLTNKAIEGNVANLAVELYQDISDHYRWLCSKDCPIVDFIRNEYSE